MYKRKTKDVYKLMCNFGYGDGWEEILEEDTYKAAKEQLKTYRENQPEFSYKIIKKRVKAEENNEK